MGNPCNRPLTSAGGLETHKKRDNMHWNYLKNGNPPPSDPEKPYRCDKTVNHNGQKCEAKFGSPEELSKHKRDDPVHYAQYVCLRHHHLEFKAHIMM
jgi:hypothetical protein